MSTLMVSSILFKMTKDTTKHDYINLYIDTPLKLKAILNRSKHSTFSIGSSCNSKYKTNEK